MSQKKASILDYPHPGLNSIVWTPEMKLNSEVKTSILELIHSLLLSNNLKHSEEWISYIVIIGSLTSYQYANDADLDVHMGVDLDKFVELESHLGLTKEQAWLFLDELRKSPPFKGHFLPNSKHPIELYFESEFSSINPAASKYDLIHDKWIKEPVSVAHDFDIEEIKPFIVDLANELAEDMDVSLGNIRRHITRIEELDEVIKEWEPQYREGFQQKIEKRLEDIEKEIKELIVTKEDIALKRRTYGPDSEQEIKFKYLQRFGYFYIISALKKLLESDNAVTKDDLPKMKEIIKNPQDKKASAVQSGVITPAGKFIIAPMFEHRITIAEQFQEFGFSSKKEAAYASWREIFEKGVVLIRATGTALDVNCLDLDMARRAEPIIYAALDKVQFINIDTLTGEATTSSKEFREKGWDAFSLLSYPEPGHPRFGRLLYTADFMPSFPAGDPGVDMSKPSDISDEETYFNPIVDKPRKDRWNKFLSMFITKKEASRATEGWLSPQGKFYEVPFNSHDKFIYEHPDLFKYNESSPISGSFEAMDKGWVRIGYYNRVLMLTSNNFSSVKQAADSWIYNHLDSVQEIELEFLDIDDDIHASKEDFLANGWEAFRAEKYGSLNKEASNTTLDPGWILPNNTFVPLQNPEKEHIVNIVKNPKRYGLSSKDPLFLEMKDVVEEKHSFYAGIDVLLHAGFIRVAGISHKVLYMQVSSFDQSPRTEDVILKHLSDINYIVIDAGKESSSAFAKDFKEKGFDAFTKPVEATLKTGLLISSSLKLGWVSYQGEILYPQDGEEHTTMLKKYPKEFGFNKPPKYWIDVLKKGNVRFLFGETLGNNSVLYLETFSLDTAKNAESLIHQNLDSVESISIETRGGTSQYYEATSKEFREKGWDAFSREMKDNSPKIADLSPEVSPPSNESYKQKKIKPMGFTELWTFYQQATPDDIAEVEDLLDQDKFQEAYTLVEKYLGRSHLKFGSDELKENVIVFDRVTGKIGKILKIENDKAFLEEIVP